MSTTHLAGPIIGIHRRRIQRCSVCGLKLADNASYPLKADGTVEDLPVWEPHWYVRQEGEPPVWTGLGPAGEAIPLDFCIELVEE